MPLKLFNTMSREVEEFKPLNPKEVTFYACGPTVYDFAHIGNLRTYISEDVLARALILNGFFVKHVINITDVGHLTGDGDAGEDKIEKSARLESRSAKEISEFYAAAFKNDFKKLNILEPAIWCRATEHIREQIELIKKLEKKGYTYQTSDGIYFDTGKVKDYGRLARLNLAGQEEGARVEKNVEKKNPADFALWKFSAEPGKRQQEWDSPWGIGFPGWHIECSAMSMKYLGETIDIHAGGIDHLSVHHSNEIAQSEAATGKQFVRYWVHGEFLIVNEERMAKSEGNFVTLSVLSERGICPMAYRLFCLSSHYRSKLNFSWEALENAEHTWEKLKTKFIDLGQQTGTANLELVEEFKKQVNEDLSIPQALAVMWKVFKADWPDFDKRATLLEFDRVLGLSLAALHSEDIDVPAEIKELAAERDRARANKKWGKADEIRKRLEDQGWQVEDAAMISRIKKKT